MAEEVAELLRQRGDTIVVAETSTGGLISSALLAVPGASAYYKGGSVLYTYESRKILLGMKRQDVAGLAPMSEAMVMAFARKAQAQFASTWAIADLRAWVWFLPTHLVDARSLNLGNAQCSIVNQKAKYIMTLP